MKEIEFINTINCLVGNEYLGDDCAYLKDFGMVITQDNLIEDIHFKTKWYTPYQLGYKSIIVNVSDILASGAIPSYLTIALSLPDYTSTDFIKEFYKGAMSASFGAKIVGGDITASPNKIFISVTAIGSDRNRKISSRKNAKPGYVVVTKGKHGSSAKGLSDLLNGNNKSEYVNAHLLPKLEYEFSQYISKNIDTEYAMMDTSDGIADALFKIAESSKVKIVVDINAIPRENNVTVEQMLYGGEDYKLIAVIPPEFVPPDSTIIGSVNHYDGYYLEINNQKFNKYNQLLTYDHFEQNKGQNND